MNVFYGEVVEESQSWIVLPNSLPPGFTQTPKDGLYYSHSRYSTRHDSRIPRDINYLLDGILEQVKAGNHEHQHRKIAYSVGVLLNFKTCVKAVVSCLATSAVIKLIDPNHDVIYHDQIRGKNLNFGLAEGSHRLDTRGAYTEPVADWFRKSIGKDLSVPEIGRVGISQPHPYDSNYPNLFRKKEVHGIFLTLIRAIQYGGDSERHTVLFEMMKRFHEDSLKAGRKITIKNRSVLDVMTKFIIDSPSIRMPFAVQAIVASIYPAETLTLKRHTANDHHGVGDVEVMRDGRYIKAFDPKLTIDESGIRRIDHKIAENGCCDDFTIIVFKQYKHPWPDGLKSGVLKLMTMQQFLNNHLGPGGLVIAEDVLSRLQAIVSDHGDFEDQIQLKNILENC
jgi:hypothetical protein